MRTSPRKAKGKTAISSKVDGSSTATGDSSRAPRLTANRIAQVHDLYKAAPGKHVPTHDPPFGKNGRSKLDCQVCAHKAGKQRKRSQVKAVILCPGCSHIVCGPTCWCELHGIDRDS